MLTSSELEGFISRPIFDNVGMMLKRSFLTLEGVLSMVSSSRSLTLIGEVADFARSLMECAKSTGCYMLVRDMMT